MAKENNILDKINQRDIQLIIFLFAPHWIKVPPLSLVYLENFISRYGFKVKIFDLNIFFYNLLKPPKNQWLTLNSRFENNIFGIIKDKFPSLMSELISQIANSEAKIIGFSLYSRNRKAAIDFAEEISKRNPSKVFVFGGPEILFEYHRNNFFKEFNQSNSYFVLGEGELPLLNICEHVYNSGDFNYSLYKGKRIISYQEVDNLDTLPLLNFDNLDLRFYNPVALPLLSSRGCIKRCSFCSEYKLYKKFRQHSPKYMIELIKLLVDKYKIHSFSFHDSLINAGLEWLDKFCMLLLKENINIKWEAQLAIRKDMTDDILKRMKEAGCFNLFVGLESGCDKILKLMHKGYDRNQASGFLKRLSSANLQYEISLIVDFPTEDEQDFKETLSFLKENKKNIPKIAQVNPFVEYPPSQINKQGQKLNFIAKDKVSYLLQLFKDEKIRYTSPFINNLIST